MYVLFIIIYIYFIIYMLSQNIFDKKKKKMVW